MPFFDSIQFCQGVKSKTDRTLSLSAFIRQRKNIYLHVLHTVRVYMCGLLSHCCLQLPMLLNFVAIGSSIVALVLVQCRELALTELLQKY